MLRNPFIEWRTDEPEIGQIAIVKNGENWLLCRAFGDNHEKYWANYDHTSKLRNDSGMILEWSPVDTPEEDRLRLCVMNLTDRIMQLEWSLARAEKAAEEGWDNFYAMEKVFGKLPGEKK